MIVQCKVIDENWKRRLSSDGIINLELSKARNLERSGKLEIVDKGVTPLEKVVTNYKTKVLMPDVLTTIYETKSSFEYKKKVKIAWVQDYSKPNGGAEISNRTVCKIGELLGFDIVIITPKTFNATVLGIADLVIINNLFEFSKEQYEDVYNILYEKRVPYIKYDHDYREIRKRADKARQMFTMSMLNVFISPDHMNNTIGILGDQIRSHSIVLPLAIDVKSYINKNMERIKGSLLIPRIEKCKANFRADFEELKKYERITIVGNYQFVPPEGLLVDIIEKQEPDKMIDLYNTYEYMYHKPDTAWAGERVYFEAKLCGCVPVINNNVGHVSWGETTGSDLEKAIYTFWKEVDKCRQSCIK
jgi:hypothetical protein